MKRIDFYVPESHLEAVLEAMFRSGAGRAGNYDRCCFVHRGLGRFRPLPGAAPFSGKPGEDCLVEEMKVELVCEDSAVPAAVEALLGAHPYETPAYSVIALEDVRSSRLP